MPYSFPKELMSEIYRIDLSNFSSDILVIFSPLPFLDQFIIIVNLIGAHMNQMDKRAKFKQTQLSMGLKKQYFESKFVYFQQQVSNSQAFLIPLFHLLPSQKHGFTLQQIQMIHAFGCQVIHQASRSLNVPICTSILAQQLFHFFFARKSFLQYDIRDIMMGAVFLACKSEQTLRKSYQVTMAFDYIFKVNEALIPQLAEGEKKVTPIQIQSNQYYYIKDVVIIKSELDILFELGFQIYRLFDIPHRYMNNLLGLFQKHPKYTQICKLSWKRLNDCYKTIACLYYPHNFIASSSIYMAMRELGANFAEIPWWTLTQSFQQAMQNIQIMVMNLQRNHKQINFSLISTKINEKGEKLQIKNVFPVPYYRKIMLQKRGKCRITKNLLNNPVSDSKGQEKEQFDEHEKDKFKDRKIYKILKNETEESKKKELQTSNKAQPGQNIQQRKTITNNNKNLLQNISQTLKKHEGSLIIKAKQQRQQQNGKRENQDGSDSQQDKIIAELIKKKKNNELNLNLKGGSK